MNVMSDLPALAVDVRAVTKRFDDKNALDDVSFSVATGSICGFLGPNGAGKTTTIRCLMDFIRPTKGKISLLGRDAQIDSTALKADIGFLSSDSQLNMRWTGDDHIGLVESIRGKSAQTKKLVKLLDLDTKARVKALSSGNKQKLAIVLAFIGHPKLLIMDEPTRGLDPMLQNILYDLVKNFSANGGTAFFSSHNLPEVQKVCDTVIIIKNGKIIAEKTMQDITGMNVHIVTATGRDPLKAEWFRSDNVSVRVRSPHELVLHVKGDISPLLKELSQRPLADLTVDHASLEDIFMEQYKG